MDALTEQMSTLEAQAEDAEARVRELQHEQNRVHERIPVDDRIEEASERELREQIEALRRQLTVRQLWRKVLADRAWRPTAFARVRAHRRVLSDRALLREIELELRAVREAFIGALAERQELLDVLGQDAA